MALERQIRKPIAENNVCVKEFFRFKMSVIQRQSQLLTIAEINGALHGKSLVLCQKMRVAHAFF
jgi:hypothetical protein